MPRSKRSKLVTLANTEKKGKDFKVSNLNKIQLHLDSYRYVWVLQIDQVRTLAIQEIRSDWEGSKLVFGKKSIIEKALGASPLEEYKENLHQLTKILDGESSLLFTNEDPDTVKAYFNAFTKPNYCRAKTVCPIDFTIPEGIVYSRGGQIPIEEDVPMPHNLEETFRTKFNIPTSIKAGKIVLKEPYVVCKAGDVLNINQALILKQFGIAAAECRVKLKSYFDVDKAEVF